MQNATFKEFANHCHTHLERGNVERMKPSQKTELQFKYPAYFQVALALFFDKWKWELLELFEAEKLTINQPLLITFYSSSFAQSIAQGVKLMINPGRQGFFKQSQNKSQCKHYYEHMIILGSSPRNQHNCSTSLQDLTRPACKQVSTSPF